MSGLPAGGGGERRLAESRPSLRRPGLGSTLNLCANAGPSRPRWAPPRRAAPDPRSPARGGRGRFPRSGRPALGRFGIRWREVSRAPTRAARPVQGSWRPWTAEGACSHSLLLSLSQSPSVSFLLPPSISLHSSSPPQSPSWHCAETVGLQGRDPRSGVPRPTSGPKLSAGVQWMNCVCSQQFCYSGGVQ